MYEYKTTGTCSTKVNFEIKDGKIYSVSFEKGCQGNLKALGVLLEGMDANEAVQKLKGINCKDKGTSCAAQFAKAVESFLGAASA